jgi:N-methylhydantoinase A/oxoprolinase/acetone carboxylase beta subunit
LSLLAAEYPAVLELIKGQKAASHDGDAGRLVTRERPLKPEQDSISPTQQEIWELLAKGPVPIAKLSNSLETTSFFNYALEGLIEYGLVVTSAFTPTDAVHVLGEYQSGSTKAADLGAEIWRQRLGTTKKAFCERVVKQVITQAGYALIESALAEDGGFSLKNGDNVVRLLVNRALGADGEGNLGVSFSLKRPIIGIGAPAVTYLKPLAEKLNTPIHIPKYAEVANAIGAAAGAVVQKARILIQQPEGRDTPYRVYAPSGTHDFLELDDAKTYARNTVTRLVSQHAHQAGASRVKIQVSEDERIVRAGTELIYLGTEITATAVGRPKLKERPKRK